MAPAPMAADPWAPTVQIVPPDTVSAPDKTSARANDPAGIGRDGQRTSFRDLHARPAY